jgi:poly-gamma-glutamate synthesis protein (capsule biosynthesis protein)
VPSAAGEALIDAGFDVINYANNHVLDRGEAALRYTMDYWDARPEVRYTGVYASEEESGKPVIIEKNNFKTGFLAYTYGLNDIPLPQGREYLVSLSDEEKMAAAIGDLRPRVDLLVVSMHWGNEYETAPSPEQKALARFLADHNVDLVIGHHPHVLEPVETLPRPDGGQTLCFYSLGNFVSAQILPRGYVLLGGLMYVNFLKDASGVRAGEAGVIPLDTFYPENLSVFKMYPLQNYTAELAARHWNKEWMEYRKQPPLRVEFFHETAKKILGDFMMLRNPFEEE